MDDKIFIATTGRGLARAYREPEGDWKVDTVLSGEDVRCLVANPRNRSIVFAGTQGDGVLRSNDAGVTWEQIGMAGETVKALAVSGLKPGRELVRAGFISRYSRKMAVVFTGRITMESLCPGHSSVAHRS